MSKPYELQYFSARGRPEPIRLLLTLAGQEFDDTYLYSEWPARKAGTPLGQLPVLIERSASGDRAIPQSGAILRHLARKHGFYGANLDENLACDVAIETAIDAGNALTPLLMGPNRGKDVAALNKHFDETWLVHATRLAKILGDRPFFAGSKPTACDMVAFNVLDLHRIIEPRALDAFPTLASFYSRVAELPQLVDYLANRKPTEIAQLAAVRASGQPLA